VGSIDAAPPAHDVFVSYSSHDKPVADAIVARLEEQGIRCWVAPRDVVPGAVWSESIVRAIESSKLMVVVFSGETNHSRQVLREVERAMANDIIVVPFRVESIEPSGAFAYYLASEHWLDAMTPPLEAHIAQLIRVASGLLASAAPAPEPAAAAAETPAPPPPPATRPAPSATRPPPPAPSATRPPPPAHRTAPAPSPPRATARAPRRTAALAALRGLSARHRVLVPAAITAAAVVVSLVLLLLLLLPDDGTRRSEPPESARSVFDLEPGDCALAPDVYFGGLEDEVEVVACDSSHDVEVVLVDSLWSASADYPGDSEVASAARTACDAAFEDHVGASPTRSSLDTATWAPDAAGWDAGDREVACAAFDPAGPLDDPVEGSGL
jgi:hypothetical protein